jgi:PAS domain S-box-containing protein
MVKSISEPSTKAIVDLRTALRQTIRVLHVDDDSGFLKVAKSFLEAQGPFEVETVLSVEEALRKLGEAEYDVVVSDYRMPGQDGLEFLKETKQQDNTIPFIIFTGRGREEVAIKALNLGADGYFNKMGCPETVYGELAHGIRLAVERKRAEMEVLKKEERLRAILASSPDGIMISDLNADVVDCNEAALRLGEYSSKKEVVGKSGLEFIAGKDRKEASEDLKEIFARGTMKNLEYTVLKKNGEEYLAELSASILKDSIGNPVGFVTVIRDISERKKAEEMLKESEQRFRCLVEEAALAMAVADTKGRLTYVNKATVDMLGYSTSQMVGQPFSNFLYPEDKGKIMRTFLKAIVLRMQPRLLEFRLVHKDGHVIHVMSRPTRLAVDGKTIGFQAIIIDITERKKMYQQLRESEAKYRELFETSIDGIATSNMDGRFTDCNQACQRMLGYSLDEMKKLTYQQLTPEKWHKMEAEIIEGQILKKGFTIEYEKEVIRKDGSVIPVSNRAWATFGDDGKPKGMWGILRDITERKKTENELRESEEKYRVLTENMPSIVYSTLPDETATTSFISDKAEELTGYSVQQFLKDPKLWDRLVHPADRERVWKKMEEYRKNKTRFCEEYRIIARDGEVRWVRDKALPVKDEQGKFTKFVGLTEDITDVKNKESELARLNEKLRIVGGLTRHDVRNKLSAIVGNTYLARRAPDRRKETLEYLQEIDQEVEQIVRILDFAKTYEMLGSKRLTFINLEKAFNEAVSSFLSLGAVKVTNDCHGLSVRADSLLVQLFYNLIDNSLKHGEKLTKIKVHRADYGDQLNLIYEDDGVGIPRETKLRLFSEGFTTGKGSGYGLYLIRRMMEIYGWAIQETGESGIGARFVITIPKTNSNGKENYRIA